MKTKKKMSSTPSRYTRGVRIGAKSRHSARKTSGSRKAADNASYQADQDAPTA